VFDANTPLAARRVLVLGGTGFIGRNAAFALVEAGWRVTIGSRNPSRAQQRLRTPLHTHLDQLAWQQIKMETALTVPDWHTRIRGFDAVLNCVGILRERGRESWDKVHTQAPLALAQACVDEGVRFVHISALGLRPECRSGFIKSKRAAEHALTTLRTKATENARDPGITIARPSLLDGEGGFGALWLQRVARWPVQFVPADAKGKLAILPVTTLGETLAALCALRGGAAPHEADLGGNEHFTIAQYLRALRVASGAKEALQIPIPATLVSLAAIVCDLLHVTPLSYGHVELLRADNIPARNRANELHALYRDTFAQSTPH
jgi:uncharacterized protein YbjT (DUF2867 family)